MRASYHKKRETHDYLEHLRKLHEPYSWRNFRTSQAPISHELCEEIVHVENGKKCVIFPYFSGPGFMSRAISFMPRRLSARYYMR